jgi:membrane protein required for colicin V production
VNWVDVTLIFTLALFGLRGYFRGLFREVLSLAGLAGGLVVAGRNYQLIAAYGEAYWNISPLFLKGASYVALFFVVYFLFSLIGWLLHRSEKLLFLQTLNRIGGIAVGIGKGTVLAALILFFAATASWLPHGARENISGALLATPLSQVAEELIRAGKATIYPKLSGEARTSEIGFLF